MNNYRKQIFQNPRFAMFLEDENLLPSSHERTLLKRLWLSRPSTSMFVFAFLCFYSDLSIVSAESDIWKMKRKEDSIEERLIWSSERACYQTPLSLSLLCTCQVGVEDKEETEEERNDSLNCSVFETHIILIFLIVHNNHMGLTMCIVRIGDKSSRLIFSPGILHPFPGAYRELPYYSSWKLLIAPAFNLTRTCLHSRFSPCYLNIANISISTSSKHCQIMHRL